MKLLHRVWTWFPSLINYWQNKKSLTATFKCHHHSTALPTPNTLHTLATAMAETDTSYLPMGVFTNSVTTKAAHIMGGMGAPPWCYKRLHPRKKQLLSITFPMGRVATHTSSETLALKETTDLVTENLKNSWELDHKHQSWTPAKSGVEAHLNPTLLCIITGLLPKLWKRTNYWLRTKGKVSQDSPQVLVELPLWLNYHQLTSISTLRELVHAPH